MNINFQKEMEKYLEKIGGEKPQKLLLHSCCAPCSSYVIEYLSNYFNITVFFYNPNIYSEEEFEKRKNEQIRLINEMKTKNTVNYFVPEYDSDEFYTCVSGYENEPERGKRCSICFSLRLEKTARYAKENDYDFFATTLTLSPLKNACLINETGISIGEKYGIKYLPSDFKKKGGYLRSIELSKEYGLYRQNFCGCHFSKNKT